MWLRIGSHWEGLLLIVPLIVFIILLSCVSTLCVCCLAIQKRIILSKPPFVMRCAVCMHLIPMRYHIVCVVSYILCFLGERSSTIPRYFELLLWERRASSRSTSLSADLLPAWKHVNFIFVVFYCSLHLRKNILRFHRSDVRMSSIDSEFSCYIGITQPTWDRPSLRIFFVTHVGADCNIESSVCEYVVYELKHLLTRVHLTKSAKGSMPPYCVVCCT